MAPQSNPAKGLQQNRPRPTAPRTIVPAIPLPYVQKRKQQEAARAKALEEANNVPVVVDTPTSPTPPLVEATPPIVDGSEDQMSEQAEESTEPTEASTLDSSEAAPIELAEENTAVEEPTVYAHEEVLGKQMNPLLSLFIL